ncbi:nuclear GTPase SLIP-GC-like isoform X2 [Halichoeres trimaculatus]|uniref:nuclear GTPase SLIP-GC-like isoform X2 n=1 Tax=Halichoeres trimaculatus TaxID=147232 RepID=UPI003D9F05D5
MDEFVRDLLTGWDLGDYIEKFREERIDKRCLFLLDDDAIKDLLDKTGPRVMFKDKLKSLKEAQNAENQVSTLSNAGDQGRRRAAPQEESSRLLTPTKKRRQDTAFPEKIILSQVKNIMTGVHEKLTCGTETELNGFLQEKISDLKIEKRELVGVFGRTGAGKSSLINAVIGEKDLLPTGTVRACTTVMIKVEANTKNQNYEAEIEFITKEDWEQDLWYLLTFVVNEDQRDEDYHEAVNLLSALYGKEWKKITAQKNLWNDRANKVIRDFIDRGKEKLSCASAAELSQKLTRFTRSGLKSEEDEKKWFWPLVKCVTVKVPNNSFLQHVTLVDLPGSGDRNNSRDKMWREVVGDCSSVWIVADINRAASEKEPWEILKNACNLMGNGGQCQEIHFVCTKSDVVEDSDELMAEDVQKAIHDQNVQAKSEVKRGFDALNIVNRHFSEGCFKVFTVSSKEFLKRKHLGPDETEVPKLQEHLQNLNDCHSETMNYVSEAKGILSLIQGARRREVAGIKEKVCKVIENNLSRERDKVSRSIQMTSETFKSCLDKGVEKSKRSCKRAMETFLFDEDGRCFHRTLKCVVTKNGVHKTTKGEQLNLNKKLASWLMDSIDETFRKTFPNESKHEAFNGAIKSFTLDTERLIERNKNVELQLIYLKTEEEKLQTELNEIIRTSKKRIYNSLMTSIEETMQPCYDEAKQYSGTGSFNKMRITIMDHVDSTKENMFETARDAMMSKLQELREDILGAMKKTIQKSIDLSLKTEDRSLPDVTEELRAVTQFYDQLKKSSDAETYAVWFDLPGLSTAQP